MVSQGATPVQVQGRACACEVPPGPSTGTSPRGRGPTVPHWSTEAGPARAHTRDWGRGSHAASPSPAPSCPSKTQVYSATMPTPDFSPGSSFPTAPSTPEGCRTLLGRRPWPKRLARERGTPTLSVSGPFLPTTKAAKQGMNVPLFSHAPTPFPKRTKEGN